MKRRTPIAACLGAGLIAMSTVGLAADWSERTQIHGFYTAQASITDESTYWLAALDEDGISKSGSFYGSRLGLNITTRVTDRIQVVGQLVSRSREEGFMTHADWAFANIDLSDSLTARIGKNKYPVGLVNEYVDVGTAYPWILPPAVIYNDGMEGPQATRTAFQGGLLAWTTYPGDWTVEVDAFGGEVDLNHINVKRLLGATARANWDDTVLLQASFYEGIMKLDTGDPDMAAMGGMDGKTHSALMLGMKADWNDWVVYAEWAQVRMDYQMGGQAVGDSDSWYATLGRRFGVWMPHLTRQYWRRGNGNGHDISTLGLNYTYAPNVVLKGEFSLVSTEGEGLFEGDPSSDSMRLVSAAINVTF